MKKYNFAGKPLLSPWEALFFWGGVGMSLWGLAQTTSLSPASDLAVCNASAGNAGL